MRPRPEGQCIADAKAEEVASLPWEELDNYGQRHEQVTSASGRTYRVTSFAFWDMDDWDSEMNIEVKAYAPTGFRRIWGYKAWKTRGGPEDPIPKSRVSRGATGRPNRL
jgi:hypothetical protein